MFTTYCYRHFSLIVKIDKKEYILVLVLQPLRWRCVDCVIHHERDVREEQQYICVARASNNKRDCVA